MTDLEAQYRIRYGTYLVPVAKRLEDHLRERLKDEKRIDRISARAKSVDRFVAKAHKHNPDGSAKYADPLSQIQDQIGARIVTFYLSDVERVAGEVKRYFGHIEEQNIVPESPREFDYEGKHYVFHLPKDIIEPEWDDHVPELFELQIKTLFQHAWGEANHDLGYKPSGDLSRDEKRRIAFTAAQAWGADQIFEEMFGSHG